MQDSKSSYKKLPKRCQNPLGRKYWTLEEKISEDHQLSKTSFATDWIKGSLTKCTETNLDTGIICVSTPNSSHNSQVLAASMSPLRWEPSALPLSSFSRMCPFSPSTFLTSLNKLVLHCSMLILFYEGKALNLQRLFRSKTTFSLL